MRGQIQAILVLTGFACLSFVMPLASLLSAGAFALVVLRLGVQPAVSVLLPSMVLVSSFGGLATGNAWLSLVYTLMLWVPTGAIAWVLRDTRNLALALELSAVLGVIAVSAVYLLLDEPARYWSTQLNSMMQPLLDMETAPDAEAVSVMQANLAQAGHYVTGLMATGAVISLILSLLVGRWWQGLLYNPGGFREEFLSLRLNKRSGVLTLSFVLVAASGLLSSWTEVLVNAGLVLFGLYLFVGIAVVHALLSRDGRNKFWLIGMYILLFAVPHLMVPLALLGLGDSWFDWRAMGATRST